MEPSERRVFLGIDYGSRRIGLAKSDPAGIIASALTTLEVSSDREAIEALREVIAEYQPSGIVIGYPLTLAGWPGAKCRQVDALVERLSRFYAGPIHKVDERLSSRAARRVVHAHGRKTGQDKKRVDRLAAVIILQQFLDSRAQDHAESV